MYDSFDNTYQATIGIDFLSKVRIFFLPSSDCTRSTERRRRADTGADDVFGGPDSAFTAVGYGRTRAIQESHTLVHPRFERGSGGL